jgi:hypothetical protein
MRPRRMPVRESMWGQQPPHPCWEGQWIQQGEVSNGGEKGCKESSAMHLGWSFFFCQYQDLNSRLLDRRSTTLATPPALFCEGFLIGSHELFVRASNLDPPELCLLNSKDYRSELLVPHWGGSLWWRRHGAELRGTARCVGAGILCGRTTLE